LMGGVFCGVAYALITQPKPMWAENETVYTSGQITWAKETERTVELKDSKLNPTTAKSWSAYTGAKETGKRYAKPVLKVKDLSLTFVKIQKVINNTWITKHIIRACDTARSQPHCINMLLGVAKAESSLFKNCYAGNCFGIKPAGKLAEYPNVKYCIDHWVSIYNKYWYNNKNWEDMINRSHYCKGDCDKPWSNWMLAVNSFIWYIK
jgi:hypothetical protein